MFAETTPVFASSVRAAALHPYQGRVPSSPGGRRDRKCGFMERRLVAPTVGAEEAPAPTAPPDGLATAQLLDPLGIASEAAPDGIDILESPRLIPIGDAELAVIETYLGQMLDDLLGGESDPR